MRVLVGVDVRNDNSGRLNFANLRRRFGGDFVGIHSAGDRSGGELFETVAKMSRRGERGKLVGAKNGLAIDQNDVATDAQIRRARDQFSCFSECLAVRHQRGRGHDAVRVGLDDGAIHTGSESEIIRVHDQTPHVASLAGRRRQARRAARDSRGVAF